MNRKGQLEYLMLGIAIFFILVIIIGGIILIINVARDMNNRQNICDNNTGVLTRGSNPLCINETGVDYIVKLNDEWVMVK